MASDQTKQHTPERWQTVLDDSDETAFRDLVEPYMDSLLKAARHDLRYYVVQNHLQEGDFTPEEVVGEALIYAWKHRDRLPQNMSLRGWLLGTQYRTLRSLVAQQKSYRHDKVISLDAPIPPHPEAFDTEEQFWEWNQPDASLLWEDIIPGQEPVDYEVPLYANDATLEMDPNSRHVLMMHDEFDLSLPEVAIVMNRGVKEIAEILQQARVNLGARRVEDGAFEEDDQPAPVPGTDE